MKKQKGRIILLGTVKGLASESKRVSSAIEHYNPGAIGIAVSEEGLVALERYLNNDESQDTEADEPLANGENGDQGRGLSKI